MTKLQSSTPILTNHRTADQLNMMLLVEKSEEDGRNFFVLAYTLMSWYGRNLNGLGLKFSIAQ